MFFVQSTVSSSNLWLAAAEKSTGTKHPEINPDNVEETHQDTDNHQTI